MARSNSNASALSLSLLLIFSIFLFVDMAEVESRQLLAVGTTGLGKSDADQLNCVRASGHKAGETCESYAQQLGITLDEFLAINPNLNCDKIFVGQWLCLETSN